MAATHHAKASITARLVRRFRTVPAPAEDLRDGRSELYLAAEVHHEAPDAEWQFGYHDESRTLSPWTRERLDAIVARAEVEARANSIPPDDTEKWGPRDTPGTDRLAAEHERWYGWGTTMPDNRAPHDRPYVPEILAYDPAADFAGLPVFRDVIRARARYFHAGCACEPPDEDDAAGWLASQYADMGPVALSWWTVRPVQAEPVQADDTLTWEAVAA